MNDATKYVCLLPYLVWPCSAESSPRIGDEGPSIGGAASLALRPLLSDLTLFSICSRSCSVRAFT